MLCQKCKKRVAAYYVKKSINDEIQEFYLCRECAYPDSAVNVEIPIGINEFLSNIIGYTPVIGKLLNDKNEELVCDNCNMNYNEFKNSGKLGCERCYDVFNDKLEPIIRRLHSNIYHIGKYPEEIKETIKVNREMEELKNQLKEAVGKEEYEKAAILRDKIRDMEEKG